MTEQRCLAKQVLAVLDGRPFPYAPSGAGFGFTILRPTGVPFVVVTSSSACQSPMFTPFRVRLLDVLADTLTAAGIASTPWPAQVPRLLAVASSSEDVADALVYLNEREALR